MNEFYNVPSKSSTTLKFGCTHNKYNITLLTMCSDHLYMTCRIQERNSYFLKLTKISSNWELCLHVYDLRYAHNMVLSFFYSK